MSLSFSINSTHYGDSTRSLHSVDDVTSRNLDGLDGLTTNAWETGREGYWTETPTRIYWGDPPLPNHYDDGGNPWYPTPTITYPPIVIGPQQIDEKEIEEIVKKKIKENIEKNKVVTKKVNTLSDLTDLIETAIAQMVKEKLEEILKEGLEVSIVKTKKGLDVKVDSENKAVQELLKTLPPITIDELNKALGDAILEDDD